MLRLSLRGLLAHKLRFLMTTGAVVIGVAFVVGSFVVTDSLRQAVNGLFTDVTEGIDVSVRASTELDRSSNDMAAARGRVSEDLVEVVRGVDGVAAAEGSISGYAQLIDADGEPLTTSGAPFLGVGWTEEDRLRPVTLDEGDAPHGVHQVAIDRGSAEDAGFGIGDRTQVLLADGTRPDVEIVGVFTFGEANDLLGARLTAFDAAVAQEVFGAPGEYDTIDVAAADGVSDAELTKRVDAALPDGVEAVTSQQLIDEGNDNVGAFLDIFQNVLLGFAAVALFVAAFYVNNTFSIVLSQRTRELALLRSLGATPHQVSRSVVGEALVIGVLASAIGVGFGLAIALLLQAILAAGGLDLPDDRLVLTARSWVAAGVVGIGVTLVASLVPARRVARVSPVVGMREGFLPRRWSRARRGWFGAGLTAAGGVLVVAGLYVAEGTWSIIGLLAAGALSVFIGVAQMSPMAAVPAADLLGRPLTSVFHQPGRLARANAMRNPERTAKTASALMIGLALVTTVFVVGESMKQTFTESIEGAVKADYIVSTESFTGFSPALTAALDELPELDAVTGVRMNRFLINGHERDLVAVDPVEAGEVVDIDIQQGSLADLHEGTIFVHQDPAQDLGLSVGDPVEVEFATGGAREVEVAGIYTDSTWAGNYLVDLDTFARYYPSSALDQFAFARTAPGVTAADARTAIEAVLAAHPQVSLEDRAEFRASQEEEFNGILTAVNALLGLALLIALLGIANTLALSVIERTREIGLLRAVGMLRRQARMMVLAESVMVAVFGALIGVVVGLLLGLAAASALPASIVATIAVPAGTLGIIVLAAALCGILAGLVPARRAAHLDVLQAIATE